MGIVLSKPSAAFPLRRLSELYRERDGDVTKLIEELEKRASTAGADQWSARVALAGIYRLEKRLDDSVRLYRAALQERPNDPDASRALADVVLESGNLGEARTLYETALARVSAQPEKEEILRTLVRISLDQKDFAAARGYHQKLVTLAQGSLFVRAELGRELLQRSEYGQAEAEYRELVKAATGDNRTLAPALRDLGNVLIRQRKNQEAIEVLRRALAIAGQAAGVRTEIHALITEAFRAEGRLPELIELLSKETNPDFQELVTLGLLYEETGQVGKALEAYRRALRANARHIDTRLKVIHILQAQGELDEAVREYEALVRSVPNNPEFVFELCEILIQRGDRAKALQLLTQAESRTRDDDQLARVADFYERIEESDRAMRIMQRLGAGGSRDPQYVIDLGDRYFQQGDKKKAVETWARLKTIIPTRAEALAALGEVYLDHDMPDEALEALREAVTLAPKNLRYLKSLAMALERTAAATSGRAALGSRFTEALKSWQQLLDAATAAKDPAQAREARMHIVTLWSLSRQLPAQVPSLTRAFAANPPNLDAGWMLAEVLIRLQRLADAETTLSRLTQLQPGDAESFLSLERVYVMQHKLEEAIRTLEKLARLDPKRARQYYQRMAQYAAELYHDDDAVKYAAQAVALAPDDAEGHRKLGEMYRRRQDNDKAIGEFRAAIAKNDRLFLVYFDLAELLLARGQSDEADHLYRRVVRSCPDEEFVARAARLSMQINLGRGTLETLERELLPVALGHPQKRVYRRLLVDLYGAMTFPLVQRVRYGAERDAQLARAELAKIGTRAVKPLLDALADDNQAQQLIAIEVLAFVENRSAAPALFAFATGSADAALRGRAMVACGALRDPDMLPRFKALLSPEGDGAAVLGGPIPITAAWGVSRMTDKRALPLMRQLAGQGTPDLRALAILGLGVAQDRASINLIADVARSPDAGNVARAAAAFALAELGATQQSQVLLALARSNDALPRQAAMLALARLEPARAREPVAEAMFDSTAGVRKSAFAAAVVLAGGSTARSRDPFKVPEGAVDVRGILQDLIPAESTPADRARALVALEQPLTQAALQAVRTSPARAQLLADALLARVDKPGLAPFTDGIETVPEADRVKAEQAAERIAAAVAPGYVALVRHPSIELRSRAIRVLARQPAAEARSAVVDALGDDDEGVQRTALSLLGEIGSEDAVRAVAAILGKSESWAFRVQAARALGSLPSTGVSRTAVDALARAARADAYALVRQAAIESLARISPRDARAVLAAVAKDDPEPRVKEIARRLLGGG